MWVTFTLTLDTGQRLLDDVTIDLHLAVLPSGEKFSLCVLVANQSSRAKQP